MICGHNIDPRDVPRAALLGIGDGFPNTSLVSMEHEYNTMQLMFNISLSLILQNIVLNHANTIQY